MGRIVAIDFGTKRTGLAVTDPLQLFASPLGTVNTSEIEEWLELYLKKEEVEAFVVGYPLQMNNMPSEAVKHINPFIRKLKKKFPGITVHLADERFTSRLAMQTMVEGGVKKQRRQDKAMIDRISASIMLQSFLDSGKTNRKKGS